ncbi:hypothetical protein DB30_01575 [Enhygromyxa salina]|uniref:Uncharacterized protein n=1 Tax=Enhygromyxa salina TaxID=215803 RepID=A0A0C1ZMR2_9BACT|nr:hypothetical protein [Enhygromyxa salina]KIG12343.1 hypothetical protein DB30_01575 [Enhygromyxa salina]
MKVRTSLPALVATLVASLGLAACHPSPGAGPTNANTGSDHAVEEDPASDVRRPDADAALDARARAESQAKVDASARRIIQEVASSRGLPVKGEFAVELISKEGVRAFVREVMHEEMTADEIRVTGRVQASLGVVPVGSDGEQVLLDLLEFGILGIYDPKRKVLLIGDYVDRGALGMVVGHEGAHGLQDMHFDLEALNHMNKGRSDLDTARTFLIEGDAQASYLAWMTGSEGIGSIGDDLLATQADMVLQIQDGMGIPYPTLARMLQMPYTDGTRSVIELARSEGWPAVDALYAQLPTTTEQMLHADKLAAREPARSVKIDTQVLLDLATDHEVVFEDELGEASLVAMLADVASPFTARKAAAGWGGDRFVALERKTNLAPAPLLVGVIAWDSVAEAQQFEPVFRDYLEKHKPDAHLLVRTRDQIIYATHQDALSLPGAPDSEGRDAALAKAASKAFSVGKAGKRN